MGVGGLTGTLECHLKTSSQVKKEDSKRQQRAKERNIAKKCIVSNFFENPYVKYYNNLIGDDEEEMKTE